MAFSIGFDSRNRELNIPFNLAPILFLFIFVLPTVLAVMLAKKQDRSKSITALVAFFLGFTFIGSWLYLGALYIGAPQTGKVK